MAETKKVSWNASQGLIMEISNRRSMANTSYISGNIKKALYTLISIKQSVIQSFNQEERDNLNSIEEQFSQVSSALTPAMSNSFNKSMKKVYSCAYNIAKKLYSKYNNYLMDLLDKYGYLIGEQSDASSMKF